MDFNQQDLVSLQKASDFLYKQWLIKKEVIMKDFIKTDF
jgi:hypothetical protein